MNSDLLGNETMEFVWAIPRIGLKTHRVFGKTGSSGMICL
jgi:hypothetical protein